MWNCLVSQEQDKFALETFGISIVFLKAGFNWFNADCDFFISGSKTQIFISFLRWSLLVLVIGGRWGRWKQWWRLSIERIYETIVRSYRNTWSTATTISWCRGTRSTSRWHRRRKTSVCRIKPTLFAAIKSTLKVKKKKKKF